MSEGVWWQGRTIVVVDDSERMREQLTDLYSDLGMKVIAQAENGVQALAIVADKQPEFLSVDIIMPEMDGIELYQNLKKNPVPPKCFFVSCLAQHCMEKKPFGEEIPTQLFVPKPATLENIKRALEFYQETPEPTKEEVFDQRGQEG